MSPIHPGFADPVHQAQRVFRTVLGAMSGPGQVQQLPEGLPAAPGLSPACTAICLALVDLETPIWLDTEAAAARDYLAFHCGTRVSDDSSRAEFAVVAGAAALPDFERFNAGSDENPERAATVILEVEALRAGRGRRLTGPGIEQANRLGVEGIPEDFWQRVRENHLLFPRGIDLILSCGSEIAALPRSVRVADREE